MNIGLKLRDETMWSGVIWFGMRQLAECF